MATCMSSVDSMDSEFGSMEPFGSSGRVPLEELDTNTLDIFSPVVVTPTQRRRAVLQNEASSAFRARQASRASNGSSSNGFRSASSSSEERTPNGRQSATALFSKYPLPPSGTDSGIGDSSGSGRSSASPNTGHRASPSSYPFPSPGFSPFTFNLWGKPTPTTTIPEAQNKENSSWNDTVWQSAYLKAASAFQFPTGVHLPGMPQPPQLQQRGSAARRQPDMPMPAEIARPLTPVPMAPTALPMMDTVPPPMPTMQRSKVKLPESKYKKDGSEIYSRKVFIGGLPPDIEDHEIKQSFLFSGNVSVDWPHKSETNDLSPPKGYAFLVYNKASSVDILISKCHMEDGSYYFPVSSQSQQNKKVQIRPWRISDSDYYYDTNAKIDPRRTVFVGGVPRPLRAVDLAGSIDAKFGNVCYAGIDTDNENDYPKGAGRVTFSSGTSYMAAINTRFIQINFGNVLKRVELKPYVLDDMMCDNCGGARCCNQPAPYFCGHVTCLTYLCSVCWSEVHAATNPTMALHRPLVKEGDRRLQSASWGPF
ncbi:cytoplasmic polyadenylation element-binding protein 3-like [Sycon ciliatum]|uniref:cytoplasmic polyadenylation element-binding protein 3-like n=1 Tax=Sycon ciliatum TaxID=27933 RepID=UPI0031F6E7B5